MGNTVFFFGNFIGPRVLWIIRRIVRDMCVEIFHRSEETNCANLLKDIRVYTNFSLSYLSIYIIVLLINSIVNTFSSRKIIPFSQKIIHPITSVITIPVSFNLLKLF